MHERERVVLPSRERERGRIRDLTPGRSKVTPGERERERHVFSQIRALMFNTIVPALS